MSRKLLPVATALALAVAALAMYTVRSGARVSARLVPKQGETLAPGVFSQDLQVAITNSMRSPIVLRGVEWEDYRTDERSWLTMVYGPAGEQPDGSISHNTMAQASSGIKFETGLILPGEERLVPAPITPQSSKHRLIIRYALAGAEGDWKKEVLLPQTKDHAGMIVEYRPATAEAIRARKGKATGDAIVRSTCKPDAVPLTEHKQSIQLSLPLEASRNKKTGGLSRDEAIRLAGIQTSSKKWLAFYRDPVHAWFFTSSDGTAVALKLVDGKWKRVPLPKMDTTAPDEFCSHYDKATLLVLRPNAFKDLVKVSTPTTHAGWYGIGPTSIPVKSLWKVLERARERNISLRFVVYNPNGLQNSSQLIAGVVVDKSGRWVDPKVAAHEEY